MALCTAKLHIIERVGKAVTLLAHIQKVLSFILDHTPDSLKFHSCPKSLQANVRIMPQLGYGHFIPNPFQLSFIIIYPFDAV
jgi:hypothetical protein